MDMCVASLSNVVVTGRCGTRDIPGLFMAAEQLILGCKSIRRYLALDSGSLQDIESCCTVTDS